MHISIQVVHSWHPIVRSGPNFTSFCYVWQRISQLHSVCISSGIIILAIVFADELLGTLQRPAYVKTGFEVGTDHFTNMQFETIAVSVLSVVRGTESQWVVKYHLFCEYFWLLTLTLWLLSTATKGSVRLVVDVVGGGRRLSTCPLRIEV